MPVATAHIIDNKKTKRDIFLVMASKDPTQTIGLRNAFIKDMNRRFKALKKVIKISIVDNDCFGVNNNTTAFSYLSLKANVSPIKPNGFQYMRDPAQVNAFMSWLETQEAAGILEVSILPGDIRTGQTYWGNKYVRSSYSKGAVKTRQKLIAEGLDLSSYMATGDALSAVFQQPVHVERAGMIYSRVYSEMSGISETMNAQVRQILTKTMASGLGPDAAVSQLKLVEDINNKVDKIGLNRSRMMARTEIVEAHGEASLNEMDIASDVTGEEILADWVTAGDEAVREKHIDWQRNSPYPLEEARDMLGEPNCRCSVIPHIKGLSK